MSRVKQDLVDHIHALIERDDWDLVDWVYAMEHVSAELSQKLWDEYITNEDGDDEVPWIDTSESW